MSATFARQEVAVDGLEPGAPGVLDALVRDLDRLGPAADQVEDGRQVGPDAEQRVGIVHLEGGRLGLAQQVDRRRSGRCPRPSATASVVVAWTSWARGDRIAGAGDLDRLAGEPLGLGEDAVEHLELGERRRGPSPAPDSARAGRARRRGAPRASPRPGHRLPAGSGPAARGAARAGPGRVGRRARRSPPRGRPSPARSARRRRPPPRRGPGGRPGPTRGRRPPARRPGAPAARGERRARARGPASSSAAA